MKKVLCQLFIMLCTLSGVLAQPQSIVGTVLDDNIEPVTGAVIEVWTNDRLMDKTFSDIDGSYYTIKLPRGKYTVKISDSSYMYIVKKVPAKNNKTTELNVAFYSNVKKREVFVTKYCAPYIICSYTLYPSPASEVKKRNKEIERGSRRMAKARKKSYSYSY